MKSIGPGLLLLWPLVLGGSFFGCNPFLAGEGGPGQACRAEGRCNPGLACCAGVCLEECEVDGGPDGGDDGAEDASVDGGGDEGDAGDDGYVDTEADLDPCAGVACLAPGEPRQGMDPDSDSWGDCCDCDSSEPLIHPGAFELCNAVDDDCDGQTDEDLFPDFTVCEVGPLSVDSIDNNCDGLTDEPGGCMVQLPDRPVWIDVYESVLYDQPYCSGSSFGQFIDDYPVGFPDTDDPPPQIDLYACSVFDVSPSRYLTFYQAERACQAVGKRLCTRDEWTLACGGMQSWEYPYGATVEWGVCHDYTLGTGYTLPTGSFLDCRSTVGAFDMVGNVWEYIADPCMHDSTHASLRGGSYNCVYCDANDCGPCDPGSSDQQEYIAETYRCGQVPSERWWCTERNSDGLSFGLRCCWDGP